MQILTVHRQKCVRQKDSRQMSALQKVFTTKVCQAKHKTEQLIIKVLALMA